PPAAGRSVPSGARSGGSGSRSETRGRVPGGRRRGPGRPDWGPHPKRPPENPPPRDRPPQNPLPRKGPPRGRSPSGRRRAPGRRARAVADRRARRVARGERSPALDGGRLVPGAEPGEREQRADLTRHTEAAQRLERIPRDQGAVAGVEERDVADRVTGRGDDL